MKKVFVGFLACIAALAAAVFVHEAFPPKTSQISATGAWGAFEFEKFKDGGSVGIRLRAAEGREETLILDRSFARNEAGGLVPREDGLLYFGHEAKSAGTALILQSPVLAEFETLLEYQGRRWAVKFGFVGNDYVQQLSDFTAALERTKRASRVAGGS
jgi:hypothetical protein